MAALGDVERIVNAAALVPAADYPGGWPKEIEAALIDAVLSIRARYGKPDSGVRRAIGLYRGSEKGRPLDNLDRLAELKGKQLARLLQNEQKTGGQLKADAIVAAAWNLTQVGVHSSGQLDMLSDEHRRAYVSVDGLGPVTWDYFGMNLGKAGVRADTCICGWVGDVLARSVEPIEARALVMAAAKGLKMSPIQLDYSIWKLSTSGPADRGGT
jgi:hypothetical protein